jgi:endonuclease-3
MKGSYILFIKLDEDKLIEYGIRKKNYFKKGLYIYVGSALNSLENRIERHLGNKKKIHWHIDYLLNYGQIINIFYRENNNREECDIANLLKKKFLPIVNFGSSDCKCKTHLFYGSKKNLLEFIIKNNMNEYYKQKI